MEQKQKEQEFTTIEIPQSLRNPSTEMEEMVRSNIDSVNERLEKLQIEHISRELGKVSLEPFGLSRPRNLVYSDRFSESEFRQSMIAS